MNTHVKITQAKTVGGAADLSRRSFLVGTAAAGLALGYSAVPGLVGADTAFAAAGNFDPSVWYSIAPDGIVTVLPLAGAVIEIDGAAAWATVKVMVCVAELVPTVAPLESVAVSV